MNMGQRLKKHRLERELTQKALGEPRYTHAYVSTIEAGRRHPSEKALKYFARKLGVEVEELRTGRPPDLGARLGLTIQEAATAISRGEYGDAEQALSKAEREAARHDLVGLRARARELRALGLERRGKLEAAVEVYDAALALLESEPPTARAFAIAGKARCLGSMGEASYAIYLVESLVTVLRREELEDPSALVQVLAPLVTLYFDAGMIREAAEIAQETAALAPRVSDPGTLGNMYVNVARRYLARGDYEQATKSLVEAEAIFRSMGREFETGVTYLAKGIVLSRQGNLKRARRHLIDASEVFSRAENPTYEANALAELGRVERLLGNTETGLKHLRQAVGYLSGGEDARTLAWAHRELGESESAMDDRAAEKHLREAILLYERSQEFIELAATHRVLGDLLVARGDANDGCASYRNGLLAAERTLG